MGGGGGGTEVGGTQIDNLEYSLSESCNCAILATERGNKRAFRFSPLFPSDSLHSPAGGGEQMDQQWHIALAKLVTHSLRFFIQDL